MARAARRRPRDTPARLAINRASAGLVADAGKRVAGRERPTGNTCKHGSFIQIIADCHAVGKIIQGLGSCHVGNGRRNGLATRNLTITQIALADSDIESRRLRQASGANDLSDELIDLERANQAAARELEKLEESLEQERMENATLKLVPFVHLAQPRRAKAP